MVGAGLLDTSVISLMGSMHHATRALSQAPSTGPVEVATPKQFVDAIKAGAADIVITGHMDLTQVPLMPTYICPDGCESPLGQITKVRSMRVQSDFS